MPSHDFKDIGDVLDFDILRGTITAIDSATDTCTVTVDGDSLEALLFYHCEPDSILRDNGAIEGAAAGFAVDDEVIVMVRKDQKVVKVIAHIDGVRHCGNYAVFKIMDHAESSYEAVVVVWNPKDDNLVMGPVLESSEEYMEWIASRKSSGDSFSGLFFDTEIPHKIDPELTDIINSIDDYTKYHEYIEHKPYGSLPYYDYFPESSYCALNLDSPEYAGFRTKHVHKYSIGSERIGPFSGTDDYYIYGPFGLMETFNGWITGLESMYFTETHNFTNYLIIGVEPGDGLWNNYEWVYNYYIDTVYTGRDLYAYIHTRTWYDSAFVASFNDDYFAVCCVVVYTPCTESGGLTYDIGPPFHYVINYDATLGTRKIIVQSQAASIPEEGSWRDTGNNEGLSEAIAQGVELYYSANEFPSPEVQNIEVLVTLV
jgi:hypothetical protein